MTFSFVFIGSTHGFIDDFIKQEEVIRSINPDFVLCEELEDISLDLKERYNQIIKEKKISNMTSFNEVEKLINLCNNQGIKLIGIDLPNFGFDAVLQRKIKGQEELSPEEEEKVENILELRDKLHLQKIIEYKKKTDNPLIIILGSWHLRENSLLRNSLNNYKIFFPCDEKGNLLIEPTNDRTIKYCEIIKNG